MRRALLLVAALAAPGTAQEAPRMLDDEEAPAFRAVGRLNIAGRRFCTATLISEREVVTAAHCLFSPRTGRRVPTDELRFVAGQRRDQRAAVRRVAAVAISPDFVLDEGPSLDGVRADVALLALRRPVRPEAAPPLAPGDGPGEGAPVSIVSYARDRPHAPSIHEDCHVQAASGGVAAVGCAVSFGASGAPVLADGPDGPELVAVVSAIGHLADGGQVALAVALAPRLEALRAALAETWPPP